MSEKKKLFPKLKKQISDFLADESGEITKKDALWIAAGATILAGVESVEANWNTTYWWSPALPQPTNWATLVSNPICSHVSWIVNGHISQTPWIDSSKSWWVYRWVATHTSHGSHGSHWSRW